MKNDNIFYLSKGFREKTNVLFDHLIVSVIVSLNKFY